MSSTGSAPCSAGTTPPLPLSARSCVISSSPARYVWKSLEARTLGQCLWVCVRERANVSGVLCKILRQCEYHTWHHFLDTSKLRAKVLGRRYPERASLSSEVIIDHQAKSVADTLRELILDCTDIYAVAATPQGPYTARKDSDSKSYMWYGGWNQSA